MTTNADKPGFDFKEWYDENGENLNKSRRDRYNTDPAYRKQVLAANRKSREKRRLRERVEREVARKERKTSRDAERSPYKVVEAEIDNVATKLFSIGALAENLRCSVQAIRIWEEKGLLPETPLRNSKGDRLYTLEQIEMIRKIFEAQGKLDTETLTELPEDKSFKRQVLFPGKRSREVELFRVGTLARKIGRTVVTVDQMEDVGRLPATPFRASKTSYRLYTMGMIEVVEKAMDKRLGHIRGEKAWKEFHDEVLDGWKKLGVLGAELVD